MATKFSIEEGQVWVPKNDGTVKSDDAKRLTVILIADGIERGETFVALNSESGKQYVISLHALATLFRRKEEV